MSYDSTPTSPRSTVPHRRWPVIGRLLSALPGPFRHITPLLLLAAVGSTGAVAVSPPISLSVTHLEYGDPGQAFANFTHGFDYLSWSGPTVSSLTVSRKILGTGTTTPPLITFASSPPTSWATDPLPSGKIAYYAAIGRVGRTEYRSNTVWCGELLANGGFNPAFPDLYWTQASTVPFNRGSFIKRNFNGTYFGQLGGVDSSSDSLSTITAVLVPVPELPTVSRTLGFNVKVRCDTTDYIGAVYDSLVCVVTNASTGAQLYTTGVLCSNMTGGVPWVEVGENLPYDLLSGKNLKLTFVAQNDYSLPTTFYIKDVTLNVSVMFR